MPKKMEFEARILKYFGLDIPLALTSEEWIKWKANYQKTFPLCYFTFRTLPIFFYRTINLISNAWYSAKTRLIYKPNIVKIKSKGFSKWHWHDRDDILIYAAFQILVDFVEEECSDMYRICFPDDYAALQHSFLGITPGVLYLKKELNETDKKILDLYNWWKARQNRPDPGDASGLYAIPKDYRKKHKKEYDKICDKYNKLEQKNDQDDMNQLIKLMKIRQALWT